MSEEQVRKAEGLVTCGQCRHMKRIARLLCVCLWRHPVPIVYHESFINDENEPHDCPCFEQKETAVVAAVQLPQHKFNPSSRHGRAKAQVRAVVAPRTLTQAQFIQTAVGLCKKYKSRATGSFLVQFFSSPACLTGWDGTGLLRDSDRPYWLCRVTVETNAEGQLYANTFKLAKDRS